jgi:hypothetical protein
MQHDAKIPWFLRGLQAHRLERIPYPAVAHIYLEIFPEYRDHPNLHQKIADTIQTLVGEGTVTVPSSPKNWNRHSTPHRPDWVRAIRVAIENIAEDEDVIAWHPELTTIQRRLPLNYREDLKKINQFLISRQGNFFLVPFRERSLEIFEDEHYLDKKIKDEHLFGGLLPLSVFGAFDSGDPLPFERPPEKLMTTGRPVLVVENQHSYWSFCQANKEFGWYAAVAYSSGNALAKRATLLEDIGNNVGSNTFRYLGDLDPNGIKMPADVDVKRKELGLPRLEPELQAYRWLLANGKRQDGSKKGRLLTNSAPLDWFSPATDVIAELDILFGNRERIAQETLSYEVLMRDWKPT